MFRVSATTSNARQTHQIGLWLAVVLVGAAGRGRASEPPPAEVREALEQAALALHAGNADRALRVLTAVEPIEPDNPWLWYYRGAALNLLDQPIRARSALDRARGILRRLGDPDPNLAALVEQQSRLAWRKTVNVSLTTGLAYDSNVSFLAGDAATLGLIAGEEDGKFSTGSRIDLALVEDGVNSLAVGLHSSHAWHFQIDPFDDARYRSHVRYGRRLADRWRGEVQYDYEYVTLDHRGFLDAHGATLAVHYGWSLSGDRVRPLESSVYYRIDVRDYRYPVREAFNQDGLTHGVGVQQTWQVQPAPQWTWQVATGYRFDYVTTEGSQYDRRANNLHVGVRMPLVRPGAPDQYLILPDRELALRFDTEWQSARYRNVSLDDRDRDRRRDRTTLLALGLSQVLRDDPRTGRWTLHLVSEWTNAESNVELRGGVSPFTYEKFVVGLLMQWSW